MPALRYRSKHSSARSSLRSVEALGVGLARELEWLTEGSPGLEPEPAGI